MTETFKGTSLKKIHEFSRITLKDASYHLYSQKQKLKLQVKGEADCGLLAQWHDNKQQKEQPTDTCNSTDETQKAKLHESTKKGNLEKAN